MRWDALFRDLEGQLEAAERAALDAEVSDRTRREAARVVLADRLRAVLGSPVALHVAGVGQLHGRLLDVAGEWYLLEERPGRQALVPAAAVLGVSGLAPYATPPGATAAVVARLRLGSALRAIARDRVPVTVVLRDASTFAGTVDRVGADFFEVAEHPPGEPRRAASVRNVRAVPFAALAAVRSG